MYLAEIERLDGDNAAALDLLLRADAQLADAHEQSDRATVQAMLARTQERLGDRAAANAAIALSDQLGAPEDVINYTITHAVRARLALAEGDPRAAQRWGRSAVEHASKTDFLAERAEAELELARILAMTGRRQAAAAQARAALQRFQAKGDAPRRAEARAMLVSLG
jgi:ATP/maltotriose-dependent transcriptional regulator MalT